MGQSERRHAWVAPSRPANIHGDRSSWSCPNCSVYAAQTWRPLYRGFNNLMQLVEFEPFAVSHCDNCRYEFVWRGDRIIDPPIMSAEGPHPDLPSPARETYMEAAAVFDASPRAAAALMRLALEELCGTLGESGKLNDSIKHLVRRGLRTEVQQALDVVRVVGNNAIHPGTIDLTDDRDRAAAMFSLVNAIVEDLITRPRQIEGLYGDLPETIRAEIERRDKQPEA